MGETGCGVEEEAEEVREGGVGNAVGGPGTVVVHFGNTSRNSISICLEEQKQAGNCQYMENRKLLHCSTFYTLCNDVPVAVSQHHISDTTFDFAPCFPSQGRPLPLNLPSLACLANPLESFQDQQTPTWCM